MTTSFITKPGRRPTFLSTSSDTEVKQPQNVGNNTNVSDSLIENLISQATTMRSENEILKQDKLRMEENCYKLEIKNREISIEYEKLIKDIEIKYKENLDKLVLSRTEDIISMNKIDTDSLKRVIENQKRTIDNLNSRIDLLQGSLEILSKPEPQKMEEKNTDEDQDKEIKEKKNLVTTWSSVKNIKKVGGIVSIRKSKK